MIRASRNVAAIAAVVALLVSGGAVRASSTAALSGFVPRDKAPVGDLSLTEVHVHRAAAPFHFKAAPGHVLFVYFGYTMCPDVCPTTLGDLKRALKALGRDSQRVDVAFATVDLQRDVPGVLEPYLASFVQGAHPLRAQSPQELAVAEHAFGASSNVTRAADGSIEVGHTSTSYLVDAHGRIVEEWGFGTASSAMAADLKLLLGQAVH